MPENLRTSKKRRLNPIPNPSRKRRTKQPRLPRPKRPVSFDLPKHLLADNSSLSPSNSSMPITSTSKSKSSSLLSSPRPSKPNTTKSSKNHNSSSYDTNATLTTLTRLTRIHILLTSLHRRNKNQHRTQKWYGPFSMLRRSIAKLVSLYEESVWLATQLSTNTIFSTPSTSSSATSTSTSTPSSAAPTKPKSTYGGPMSLVKTAAQQTRHLFTLTSHLRTQRDMLESHIRENLVPAAYVAFSSVVAADAQFANLGVVLLGVLGDVVGVVGLMTTTTTTTLKGEGGGGGGYIARTKQGGEGIVMKTGKTGGIEIERLVGMSTVMTGADRGVVVERVWGAAAAAAALDGRDTEAGEAFQEKDDGEEEEEEEEKMEMVGERVERSFTSYVVSKTDKEEEEEEEEMLDIDINMSVPPKPPQQPLSSSSLLSSTQISNSLPSTHLPNDPDNIPKSPRNKKTSSRSTTTSTTKTSTPAKATTTTTTTTTTSSIPTSNSTSSKDKSGKSKKKKAKATTNAIDDLFSGFD